MIPITSYTKSMYRIHTHILGTSLLREEYDAYTVVYHIYTKRERARVCGMNHIMLNERCAGCISLRVRHLMTEPKKSRLQKKRTRDNNNINKYTNIRKKTHTTTQKNSLNHIARSFHLSSDSAMHIVRQCLCSLYQMYARSNT